MLAKMSLKYKLSKRYTNHSIRVTSMQILEDNNVEGRHIQRVSGHKSPESITTYARRLSTARKRNISNIFSASLGNQPSLPEPISDSSVDFSIKKPMLAPKDAQISATSQPQNVINPSIVPIPNNIAPSSMSACAPVSVAPNPLFQEMMAIQQNRIANMFNDPTFIPTFSLAQQFDMRSTTTTTTATTKAQNQQPIYNLGTINIYNHYHTTSKPDSPFKAKRLRIISDSEGEE